MPRTARVTPGGFVFYVLNRAVDKKRIFQTSEDYDAFIHRLTTTHVQRWKQRHGGIGLGPLYQGRYKSFPVHTDEHLLVLIRYVEANALRAGLVSRAEDWPHGSLTVREKDIHSPVQLNSWPIDRPSDWVKWVNEDWNQYHLDRIRECSKKNKPYGPACWTVRTAKELKLQSSLRANGRPKAGEE